MDEEEKFATYFYMEAAEMRQDKTFVIQIKDTQASTWQGTVVWVEKEKKEIFRSALELMKLLDSAVKEER